MKTDLAEARVFEHNAKMPGYIIRVNEIANLIDENVLIVLMVVGAAAPLFMLLDLFFAFQKVRTERVDQWHSPVACTVFCRVAFLQPCPVFFIPDLDDRMPNREAVLFPIDRRPLQSDSFTSPEPVEGCELDDQSDHCLFDQETSGQSVDVAILNSQNGRS